MRLIDADVLKMCYTGSNGYDDKAEYFSIRKMIDLQPTAFDLESVIQRFKKEKDDLLQQMAGYNNFSEIPSEYKFGCGVYEKAIHILKSAANATNGKIGG